MENGLPFYLFLLVCFEMFESWWQHDVTLGRMLEKIRHYYHTNIFLLFIMHPSFWLVLYLFVKADFRGTLLSLMLVMKAVDIAFKLWMVAKIDEGALSSDFRAMLDMPLAPWMPWINMAIYPLMLAFALHG